MHIRRIRTTDPAYPQVWELRDAVLRRPLGHSLYNDDTSRDSEEIILVAEEAFGRVVGCVMLRPVPGGAFKLRQMAVYDDAQGLGVGRALVQHAEAEAWAAGAPHIELHARAGVLPFYEKLGYNVSGEEFLEVGIPHRFAQKVRPV